MLNEDGIVNNENNIKSNIDIIIELNNLHLHLRPL